MLRRGLLKGLMAAAVLWPTLCAAQTYPTRPITMIVPFAAGGTFDVIGRIVAGRMTELLGQSVLIENVTGAAGINGVLRLMNAAPDGYTVLLGTVGTHVYDQWIHKKPRYDAVRDFTPVALFSEQPMVLEARKDLPADTLQEFAALLKANGTKMQFGSAGAGSTTHLACAMLNARIGVTITHVPYRGSAPAANDLIGGQIDYLCGNLGAAVGRIATKQEKVLAVFSRERTPLMPELQTADEQGLKDLDITTWTAFFLPKGAPRNVVDILNKATHDAMDSPGTKKRLEDIGVTSVAGDRRSPDYLTTFLTEEIARWETPIKSSGLQQD